MTAGMSRRLLTVVVLAVTLVAAGCDWQQFGNDGGNTHASADPGIGAANVGTLAATWTGTVGAPVNGGIAVAGGVAYVGANDGKLYAFDTGASGCAGTPKSSAPLWTGTVGSLVNGSPAVADGLVYAKSSAGTLAAFDAAGVTGCSGTPKVCTPRWTAALGSQASSPTVANGFVYVGTATGLRVYDGKGVTGCSGTPRTCTPLWTAPTPAAASLPAVGNGIVAVGSDRLYAFDATGTTGCSGAPKICAPMWATSSKRSIGAPAIADGRVHVQDLDGLYAYPATAGPSCGGAPLVCAPLWSAPTNGVRTIAVGNGLVYSVGDEVAAYCRVRRGRLHRRAARLRAALDRGDRRHRRVVAPLANGLLYVAGLDQHLSVFDANGVTGCGGAPTTCVPLSAGSIPTVAATSVAIARGVVYVASGKVLSAYAPVPYTRPTCPANPHTGLGPCEIQDAYRLPSATAGQDQTVAIVDAFNDPKAEADLAVYRAAYGLAPCTSANGCFSKVNQRGIAGAYPPADVGWAVEISLDLDMVSATCPRCRILLVEADDNSTANLAAAVRYAVGRHPAAVSNSYGGPEAADQSTVDGSFTSNDVAVVVATGDSGYGPSYPASAPGVVAVGGTNLLPAVGTTHGWTETAWAGAGSGCSAYEPKPPWQTDTGCNRRTLADVSAVAGDPGLAVYDTYGGVPGWITVEGTSASTPIVSSVYALAPTVGRPAALWANPDGLFDVTSGANGTCTPAYLCTAGSGFDGPTGNGTPCGTRAFSLVASVAAPCSALGATGGLHAGRDPPAAGASGGPGLPARPARAHALPQPPRRRLTP